MAKKLGDVLYCLSHGVVFTTAVNGRTISNYELCKQYSIRIKSIKFMMKLCNTNITNTAKLCQDYSDLNLPNYYCKAKKDLFGFL